MSHINIGFKYGLQNTTKFNQCYDDQFKSVFSNFLEDGNYILGKYVNEF